MEQEKLLATYSLLAYIRENSGEKDNKSILKVFLPILKETLNRMLCRAKKDLKGKDYTEIQQMVEKEFGLKIPIPVINTLMLEIKSQAENGFVLNNDHSFILQKQFYSSVGHDYIQQKRRIENLEHNYSLFCEGLGVTPDFKELVQFIQDQKNRIFENKNSSINNQEYHVSKYVYSKLKMRDQYFDIICDIYLGGVIASYLQFQIKERISCAELLVDTNFYISLINLNTEEAYESCKQLYELTIPLGYRYTILESTIEQIKILLSARAKKIERKGLLASLDIADVLSACERRGLTKTDLERYKDGLLDDLSKKGVSIVYNSSIRTLIESTERSSDLSKLTKIRGSKESAFNDLLAQEYVAFRRKGTTITEFNDVNCWFLNNSFSVNWKEKDIPVWQRKSITASDLLVLLWLANPSLAVGQEKKMLAITSLSANVVNFRSSRYPSDKVVGNLQDKIAKLQKLGDVSEKAVAKLCIRMAEGAISQEEAEKLLLLSTTDLKKHIDAYLKMDEAYIAKSEELENKKRDNSLMEAQLQDAKLEAQLFKMRTWGIVYLIVVIAIYFIGKWLLSSKLDAIISFILNAIYWIVTTVLVNWFNHLYFVDGLKSFFDKEKVKKKMKTQLDSEDQLGV